MHTWQVLLLCLAYVFGYTEVISNCDVVIVGGSTSALAAAFAAASSGVKTCLLEPTNWIGGQLTASGVPAIDFSHVTRKAGNEVNLFFWLILINTTIRHSLCTNMHE